MSKTHVLELLELSSRGPGEVYPGSAVGLARNRFDFLAQAELVLVEELERLAPLSRGHFGNSFGKRFATLAALLVNFGNFAAHTAFLARVAQLVQIRSLVARKTVDRNDRLDAVLANVVHVPAKIVPAPLFTVATVKLDGLESAHDNGRIRLEPGLSTFNIKELLGAKVRTESSFRNQVIRKLQSDPTRQHARASMSDIGKGPSVDNRR